MIVCDNKTQHFATSDLERVVSKFQELNSGAPASEESELDRLWKRNEDQRREIEGLRRQLAEEKQKLEALVGPDVQMLTVHPTPALVNTTPVPLGMVQSVPLSQPMSSANASINLANVAASSMAAMAAMASSHSMSAAQSLSAAQSMAAVHTMAAEAVAAAAAAASGDGLSVVMPGSMGEPRTSILSMASDAQIPSDSGLPSEPDISEPNAKRTKLELVS